jgi:hypothetical protein
MAYPSLDDARHRIPRCAPSHALRQADAEELAMLKRRQSVMDVQLQALTVLRRSIPRTHAARSQP